MAPEDVSVSRLPELRALEVFLVLCRELNFARTAERVALTTSRVSQTIRELERDVGGRLFERTSRRVETTPLGELLRAEIEPAYLAIDQGWRAARRAGSTKAATLRLGMYTPVSGGPWLTEIVAKFESSVPGGDISVIDTGFDALAALRRGVVDVLAQRLPLSDPEFVVGPVLSCESRVVMVGTGHPLAGRESVTWEDVGDYVVSGNSGEFPDELIDAFAPPRTPSGRLIRRRVVPSFADCLTRVALGEHVHPTVPSLAAYLEHPGITWVPVSDLPMSRSALVWLASRDGDPLIDALAATVRGVVPRTEG